MRTPRRFPPVPRRRATRRRIRRLVVELEERGGGAAEEPLRRALGDPTVRLAFRLGDRDAWVDAAGRRVALPAGGDERTVTYVHGPDGPLAALDHNARLRGSRRLLDAVVAGARLALENERLEAELRARIADVRASRRRLVATADAERRRIERDLHDGAQQRLVSLSIGLQMVGIRLGQAADPLARELLTDAIAIAQEANDELRRIAQGIFPAGLAEEGLAAALEDLAAAAPIRVELGATPQQRVDETAEAIAYFVALEAVATAARRDPEAEVRLAARSVGEHLELTVERLSREPGDLRSLELEDRIDAVGGRMTAEPGRLWVELPAAVT